MSAVVGGKLQVLYVPDTGADMTVLPAAMFERAKAQGAAMRVVEYEPHKEVYLADGGLVTIEKKVVADLTLSTLAGPTVLRGVHMDIMPGPGEELLLGQPEWSSLGLPSAAELIAESVEQNAEANTARGRSVRRVRAMAVFADEYPQFVDAHEEELKNVLPVPVNDKAKGAKLLDEAMEAMLARAEAEGAPVEFLTGMKKLLTEKGGRVFRLDISGEEPPANLEPFDIEFMDGAPLPRQPAARRYSPEHKAAMDEQVAALLAAGLIREGTGGAIVSPTHMVRKPNGTDWRMTIDYRAINRITVPRPFPIPLLESEYMQTQGAKVFASLDFPKGFWQILNTKRAAKRSAFATHNGVYEPERMQMGNRNAAQHFQCEVTKLLRQHNLLGKSVQSFIDDLLLYAKSWQDLLEVWSRVLDALIQAGLFVTPLKTNLWCKEVVWCGNMLSAEGVEVDPARLNALAQIQEPQNAGELMQFLAAVNFIRGKIPRYAQHVAPLQDILQKALQTCKRRTKAQAAGVQLSAVGWGEESKAAFKGLKVAISSAVKLTLPDASCEFCLMTDASEDHWGAVLTQVNAEEFVSDVCVEEMQHQPLAFLSGTFRGSQKMWSSERYSTMSKGAGVMGGSAKHSCVFCGVVNECQEDAKAPAAPARTVQWYKDVSAELKVLAAAGGGGGGYKSEAAAEYAEQHFGHKAPAAVPLDLLPLRLWFVDPLHLLLQTLDLPVSVLLNYALTLEARGRGGFDAMTAGLRAGGLVSQARRFEKLKEDA